MTRPALALLASAVLAAVGGALAAPATQPAKVPAYLDLGYTDGTTIRRANLTAVELEWVDKAFGPPAPVVPPVVEPPKDPNGVYVVPGQSWVAAARTVKSGQTLYLSAGTWTEGLTDTAIRLVNVRIKGAGRDAQGRPLTVVRVPSGVALNAWCWDLVQVDGISFQSLTPTDKGLFIWGCRNLSLTNVGVDGFTFGVCLQPATGGGQTRTCDSVTLDGCDVTNNRDDRRKADKSWPDASGLFATKVTNLKILRCLFDHNGWSESGSPGTLRDHNCYLAGDNGPATVADCVFARAGSHGLQLRCGGTVSGCTFLNNPIGLSVGLVNGGGPLVRGGVTAVVSGNTFVGTRLMAGSPRGYALEVSNAKDVKIVGNTFADDHALPDKKLGVVVAAIKVDVMNVKGNPQDGQQVTVVSLTVADNAVTWPGGPLWVHPDIAKAAANAKAKARPSIVAQTVWPPADVAALRATATAKLATMLKA